MIEKLFARTLGFLNSLSAPISTGRPGDEKALEKLTPPETKAGRFKPSDELLAVLVSL
jgi:hypothetical protein